MEESVSNSECSRSESTWISSFRSQSFLFRKKVKETLVNSKYRQHVIIKWKKVYFPYDEAKFILGSMSPTAFDSYFDSVIRVVINFIETTREAIRCDIVSTIEAISILNQEVIVDREFLKLHAKLTELKKFQRFNKFYILKFVQKYYRPLLQSQNVLRKDCTSWSAMWSHQTFLDLCQQDSKIDDLRNNLLDNYIPLKRPYVGDQEAESRLHAEGELEFPVSRDEEPAVHPLSLKIGLKSGVVAGCACMLILKKYVLVNIDLSIEHPGINIFGAYAAYLLYRLTWLLNVSLWNRKAVQYIHFFRFGIVKAQTLRIINEILTEVVILLIFYILYVESLTAYSALYGVINPGYVALTALVAMFAKLAYHLSFKYGKHMGDRGVFTLSILLRCLTAPYFPVTFRDKIAANILTSFSRPTADFLRGSCWLMSGQLASSDRHTTLEDVDFCEDRAFYVVIVSIQMFFGWIRMVQCLRGAQEAGWRFYPNGLNSCKYALGCVAKLIVLVFPSQALSVWYIALLVFNALLRWYWDVVMDWGLGCVRGTETIDFSAPWGYPSDSELGLHSRSIQSYFVDTTRLHDSERLMERSSMSVATNEMSVAANEVSGLSGLSNSDDRPSSVAAGATKVGWKYFLLRSNLFLFEDRVWIYHLAIFSDLVLRFFFVISFLPQQKLVQLLGSQLPFYLGCLEILRRAVWMLFRLEWEHIKFVALCNERKGQLRESSEGVSNVLHKKS